MPADGRREVVDERQLPVALEGLVRERALVPLARGGVGEHRGDPTGGAAALDGAEDLALDGDVVAFLAGAGT